MTSRWPQPRRGRPSSRRTRMPLFARPRSAARPRPGPPPRGRSRPRVPVARTSPMRHVRARRLGLAPRRRPRRATARRGPVATTRSALPMAVRVRVARPAGQARPALLDRTRRPCRRGRTRRHWVAHVPTHPRCRPSVRDARLTGLVGPAVRVAPAVPVAASVVVPLAAVRPALVVAALRVVRVSAPVVPVAVPVVVVVLGVPVAPSVAAAASLRVASRSVRRGRSSTTCPRRR
jgi:hypothetical protein